MVGTPTLTIPDEGILYLNRKKQLLFITHTNQSCVATTYFCNAGCESEETNQHDSIMVRTPTLSIPDGGILYLNRKRQPLFMTVIIICQSNF